MPHSQGNRLAACHFDWAQVVAIIQFPIGWQRDRGWIVGMRKTSIDFQLPGGLIKNQLQYFIGLTMNRNNRTNLAARRIFKDHCHVNRIGLIADRNHAICLGGRYLIDCWQIAIHR